MLTSSQISTAKTAIRSERPQSPASKRRIFSITIDYLPASTRLKAWVKLRRAQPMDV